MREETHTKWCQGYEVGNDTRSRMEDQLQRLIKVVTDSSMDATKVIPESNHEEFGVVRDRLDSIFGIVYRNASTRTMMQDILSIDTESWDRKVQVPLTAIDMGNEEFHQLLRLIQSVALDLNKLSTMTLVELHYFATLELEEQKKE